jgi:hypothetical protein
MDFYDQKPTAYLHEFVRSLMRSSSGRAPAADASGLGADSRDPFLHGPGDELDRGSKLEADRHAGRPIGGLHLPMKLVATASGWRTGSFLAGSRLMSSIRRALRRSHQPPGQEYAHQHRRNRESSALQYGLSRKQQRALYGSSRRTCA